MELQTFKDGDTVPRFSKALAISKCSNSHAGVSVAQYEIGGLANEDFSLFCPLRPQNIKLIGNHLESDYQQLAVYFTACDGSNNPKLCSTRQTYDSFFANVRMLFFAADDHVLMKTHQERPIYREYIKILELNLHSILPEFRQTRI